MVALVYNDDVKARNLYATISYDAIHRLERGKRYAIEPERLFRAIQLMR